MSNLFTYIASFSNLFFSVTINMALALSIYINLKVGQLSLANIGFMAIGAYVSAILTTTYGLPFLVGILVGGILSLLLSILLGIPALRLKGVYFAIATVGFGEIVKLIMLNMVITGGAMGIKGIPRYSSIAHVLLFLCVLIYIFHAIESTQFGRTLVAIREDEPASRAMGINTLPYKMFAFCFGAVIASIAGSLSAHNSFIISPHEFGFYTAVNILLFVIFGGLRIYWGPILGAAILTVMPEAFRFLADFRLIIYGLALILVIIYLPNGIIDVLKTLKNFRFKRDKTSKKSLSNSAVS